MLLVQSYFAVVLMVVVAIMTDEMGVYVRHELCSWRAELDLKLDRWAGRRLAAKARRSRRHKKPTPRVRWKARAQRAEYELLLSQRQLDTTHRALAQMQLDFHRRQYASRRVA